MTRAATKLAMALLLACCAGCENPKDQTHSAHFIRLERVERKVDSLRDEIAAIDLPLMVVTDTGSSAFLLYDGRVWRPDATPEQPR